MSSLLKVDNEIKKKVNVSQPPSFKYRLLRWIVCTLNVSLRLAGLLVSYLVSVLAIFYAHICLWNQFCIKTEKTYPNKVCEDYTYQIFWVKPHAR